MLGNATSVPFNLEKVYLCVIVLKVDRWDDLSDLIYYFTTYLGNSWYKNDCKLNIHET